MNCWSFGATFVLSVFAIFYQPMQAVCITETNSLRYFDDTSWVNIRDISDDIVLDIRYATSNNFVEEQLYNCEACYLRRTVAIALYEAHCALEDKGLGLKVYDCYRPKSVQQKLWNKVPDARYVTPPSRGSMHNRGAAVDVTIVDSLGKELDMGTSYDYFGRAAYHTYQGHSKTILQNRILLKTLMLQHGFRAIRTEWWHYSYRKTKGFRISNMLWTCD